MLSVTFEKLKKIPIIIYYNSNSDITDLSKNDMTRPYLYSNKLYVNQHRDLSQNYAVGFPLPLMCT